MHKLDNHINDIEPRIRDIYQNIPKQEEPSLQESLAAYGWILLDSWVAWRTLRFLLRDTDIDQDVSNKWFQTPSSYNASQLKAVWKFSESTVEYIASCTNHKLKDLIDKNIQKKRNTIAHATNDMIIRGTDWKDIEMYFVCLSRVFSFYETFTFVSDVIQRFEKYGFSNFYIKYSHGEQINIDDIFDSSIQSYVNCEFFDLSMNKGPFNCYVRFAANGCLLVIPEFDNSEGKQIPVTNDSHSAYSFLGNKGYYVDVNLFVDTIINLMKTCE